MRASSTVDLVDVEGELEWWKPYDLGSESVPFSMRLVPAIVRLGLVSREGFAALRAAWAGFDPACEQNCWDWQRRTQNAIEAVETTAGADPEWPSLAQFVVDQWPMPMTGVDLTMTDVTVADLQAERARAVEGTFDASSARSGDGRRRPPRGSPGPPAHPQ